MHVKGHNLYRRSIAAFLFLLFCVIYSGKAIHTHEQHPTCSAGSGFTVSNGNVLCAICEFQLSKDLEMPVSSEEEKLVIAGDNEIVYHPILIYPAVKLQLKDRAPPVLS